jgi:hypothetical protein
MRSDWTSPPPASRPVFYFSSLHNSVNSSRPVRYHPTPPSPPLSSQHRNS